MDESSQHNQRQLAIYRTTLRHLLDQAAKHGGEDRLPTHLMHDLRDTRTMIAALKVRLREQGQSVTDEPDDVASAHVDVLRVQSFMARQPWMRVAVVVILLVGGSTGIWIYRQSRMVDGDRHPLLVSTVTPPIQLGEKDRPSESPLLLPTPTLSMLVGEKDMQSEPSPPSGSCYTHTIPDPPQPIDIEAEDFMCLGAGKSYQDDPVLPGENGNVGKNDPAYRPLDAVDIDESGGHRYVGWTKTGEWLRYHLEVKHAGQYTFAVRVANKNTSGKFQLEIDDNPITPVLAVPNTEGKQHWQFVTIENIELEVGVHTLKLLIQGNEGDYDVIRITPQ
jgi:hypothetical protein